MEGHEVFGLIFITVAVFGPLLAVFWEYGTEAIADKLVKLLDSYNKKKKDI
jgi:hypothetical protein